jgi:hypothetical protein
MLASASLCLVAPEGWLAGMAGGLIRESGGGPPHSGTLSRGTRPAAHEGGLDAGVRLGSNRRYSRIAKRSQVGSDRLKSFGLAVVAGRSLP